MLEIVMPRRLDTAQLTAEIDRVAARLQVADAGVLLIRRAEHGLRFRLEIGPVDARYLHRRDEHAFAVAQCDRLAELALLGELLRDVERDRHRPQDSAREAHV